MAGMPTINDICSELGLSKATVSKALNGYSSVREETRQRVLDYARKIGYTQTPRTGESNARLMRVGFITTANVDNPDGVSPYQNILGNLLNELSQYHYDTVLIPPSTFVDQSIPYEQAMRSLNLNCAFITGLRIGSPYYKQLMETTFPTILWDMYIPNPCVHNVSCDSTEGLRMATEHLISLGHKRIGYINGHSEAQVSIKRLEGYILAMISAGLPYDPELVYTGDFSEASGVLGFHKLIQKDITGLVCVSDVCALGAMRAAQAMGYSIPGDISIVGYDNTNMTTFITPALTSIDQHTSEIGRIVATMIRNVLHERTIGDSVVHPSLVLRGSTAAPGKA